MSTARRAVLGLLVLVLLAAGVVGALALRDDDGTEDTASFALGATPGEIKVVKTGSGWRIDLDTELPRLDGGEFYQAWLRNEAGTLVPIGSFNEGDDVVLWAGVSPVDFPTLTVTREKADGDQASSGDRVLTGEFVPVSD